MADQKVKELLTEGTRADLERWFGLPSFDQLAEEGKLAQPPVDPERVAADERRATALAAIDPALLEAHRRRVEPRVELIKFRATLELRVDPDFALLDVAMIRSVAEPRDVEIPTQLKDDLRECAPQALLRDLHRSETYFQKTFEIVDVIAEERRSMSAVREALATPWKPLELEELPSLEARRLHREGRNLLRRRWTDLEMNRPNRKVTE